MFGFQGASNRGHFCGNAEAAGGGARFQEGTSPPPLRIPPALRGGREFSGASLETRSAPFAQLLWELSEGDGNGSHFQEFAPLAQLVEQLTLNQWVPGSSP